jgi:signal recognition particle receptor subunit beta
MVQFNFGERTIKAKVVYYGPAQSGKTTNLEQIHRITDPASANRLISLNTAQDRTLFFDLLPFSLGAVSGYDFKVQLYTVPGQVQYNATRRVVLAGADAVVFVADSRRSMIKENVAAFENMKVNLLANRLVPEKVPLVLQYNKQDLPELVPQAELDKTLNPWGRPAFPASAANGDGVVETFTAVVQEMLTAIAIKYNLREKGLDPGSVPQLVQEAFATVLRQASEVAASQPPAPELPKGSVAVPGKVILTTQTDSSHAAPPQSSADSGLVSEELLHRSIRTNVELAEALSGLARDMNLGLGSILSHAELLMMYREDAREKRNAAIQRIQEEASRLRKIIQELGNAGAAAAAHASGAGPAPTPVARPPAPRPAAATPATPRAAGPAPLASGPGTMEAALLDVVAAVQPALDARGLSFELKIPPGTAVPRVPAQNLHRALAGLFMWLGSTTPDGPVLPVRCERKPVLLRSRDGEVKRDFLMLSLGNAGQIGMDDQQRIMQGTDPGLAGQAAKFVREMGGFLRFAPLAGGGTEMRVFLPAA